MALAAATFLPSVAALQGPHPQASAPTKPALRSLTPDEEATGWERFGEVTRFLELAAQAPFRDPAAQTPGPAPEPAAPRAPAPVAPAVQPEAPPRASPPPAPAAPPPAPAPAAAGLDTSPLDAFEQGLLDATNRRRVNGGLAPLTLDPRLAGLARLRSGEMAQYNYFSHTSPVTGDTVFSLMDSFGIPFGWAGENLAKNNYPDGQVVAVADESLWNSPSHRENMLNPHFTQVGIGFAVDASGMKYLTVVFTGPA
ncbi:MAG: CAP domain-containing protein [Dehalococcoidia bacterium]